MLLLLISKDLHTDVPGCPLPWCLLCLSAGSDLRFVVSRIDVKLVDARITIVAILRAGVGVDGATAFSRVVSFTLRIIITIVVVRLYRIFLILCGNNAARFFFDLFRSNLDRVILDFQSLNDVLEEHNIMLPVFFTSHTRKLFCALRVVSNMIIELLLDGLLCLLPCLHRVHQMLHHILVRLLIILDLS